MYEFSFTIRYDAGADEFMDLFIEHGSLRSETLAACLEPSQMWRLEVVTGDPDELAAVDGALLDETLDRDSISDRDCDATRHISRLDETPRRRVTYTYLSEITSCDAVPVLAVNYLTRGLLFRQTRSGQTVQWRVLTQDDEKIGMLYDTLTGRLGDGLTFLFDHMTEVDHWERHPPAPDEIRADQRAVLVAAVDGGYFEIPREVTLDELAADLDLPRSTVSYRLRRAVAEIAESFVDKQSTEQ